MEKRSKTLLVATILATLYVIYLFSHFFGGVSDATSSAEAVGASIATAIVMPHMMMFLIGAAFGWLGVFLRKGWAALVGAILYAVGTVLFMVYAMFGVPILILGFVGYSKQSKINKAE